MSHFEEQCPTFRCSTIEPEEVDPIYFDGRMSYLLAAKPEDQESFEVFNRRTGAIWAGGQWDISSCRARTKLP
jgi:hypothetical protein